MLNKFYDAALALAYPQACAVCGASVEHRADAPACVDCWAAAKFFNDDECLCWKCGVPLRGNLNGTAASDVRCQRCEHEAFTAARAVGLYHGALRAAVLELKREPHLPGRLKALLAEAQRRKPLEAATCIVPVPLHPARRRERGFNQAEVIARELAAATALPLDELSVVRTRHNAKHRAGMDGTSRRRSVRNVFSVERPRLLANQRVLLVDDVFTTGATVTACAQALKAIGVLDVFVLTIARTGLTSDK